jgi:hypothetical protein
MAYGIHFYERLCRGGACLLEIPFPRYFLHSEPLIFPFDTQLSFASPLYKVSSFIPLYFTGQ